LIKEWNDLNEIFNRNICLLFENYKENERILIPLMNFVKFEIEKFLIKNEIEFINKIQILISIEMKSNFGTIFKQLTFLSL